MEITLAIISVNLCYIGYVLNEILKEIKNRYWYVFSLF
jgi:hypothetical protein